MELTVNAMKVLERRYLLKDEQGRISESPADMFSRVARAIASMDEKYDVRKEQVEDTEEKFYNMMSNLEFLPNTPTLMNAGTKLGQLAACFVLPVHDSIESIFDTLKHAAIIHKTGGGTGFNFSNLRPAGDFVKTTGGVASGPISFMKIFDTMTNQIKQGGKRRGANMGILNYDHPDIIEFINAKLDSTVLPNFNISVAVDDKFFEALEKEEDMQLINPRTKNPVKKVNSRKMFELIVNNAWETGDPGLIFLDTINKHHPASHVGRVESTNPCGEVPLLPYEQCTLGSINLSKFVNENEIQWDRLRDTVKLAIHFLDNVIDANSYPIPEIEKMAKANRKIGLGVMGFADLLIKLGIPYNSDKGLETAEKIMKFIENEAHEESTQLGKERGSFPNFNGSLWEKKGYEAMRNATCTTIAPTGTISIIAGCSSGIEPIFAVAFMRNVMEGSQLLETTPTFEQVAKKRGFYSEELVKKIAKSGSVQQFEEVPEDVKKVFVTSLDISPEWHVKMQASFQKYTDNAVSKTINLPKDARPEDVKNAYLLAYRLGCKGITIYRYGSKENQVLTIGELEKTKGREEKVIAESEYSGGSLCVVCPH